MNTLFEDAMPCECPVCGSWVDLMDMYPVRKWEVSPGNLICQDCHRIEEAEIQKDNEVESIFDAVEQDQMMVREAQRHLRNIGFNPDNYPDLKDFQLAKSYPKYRKNQ